MKKIVSVISLAALLIGMTACERENLAPDGGINPDFKVTATIEPIDNTTRVGYTVDNSENTVTPEWQVDDQIFGFDNEGNTFTYRVSAVDDGTKEATLALVGEYTPGSASKAYAIYYPGKTISNLSEPGAEGARTLAVDLSAQSGALNTSSPVLMCATADITPGGINFSFQNQTAIIGVKAFQLPEAATITSMDLNGVITTGTFSVDEGVLKLTPGTTPTKVTATGSWTTEEEDSKQKCKTGVYFAALPMTGANLVLNASSATKEYANVTAIASTNLEAGNYYYMSKILAGPVAEVNGVKYATIEEAFAVANRATDAVTIRLLNDCEASTKLVLDDASSANVTLDLDTFTLSGYASDTSLVINHRYFSVVGTTGKITSSTGKYVLKATNTATLSVAGGTIEATGNTAVFCGSTSTLYVTGGTITSTVKRGIQSEGVVYISGGHVNTDATGTSENPQAAVFLIGAKSKLYISGGELSTTNTYTSGVWLYEDGPEVEMTAGIINANWGFFQNKGANSLIISGGTITGTSRAIYLNNSDATATITGGSFTSTNNPVIDIYYGTANISDGTFHRIGGNVVYTRNTTAFANVSGGTYTSTIDAAGLYANKGRIVFTDGFINVSGINPVGSSGTTVEDGVAYVTGGYFTKAQQVKYLKDTDDNAYTNILNTDPATKEEYPYTVSPVSSTPVVASVSQSLNNWNHATMESAFYNANMRAKGNGAATITLRDDVTVSSTMSVSSGNNYLVTLDLNGYTVSSSASPVISSAAAFTLKNTGATADFVTSGDVALAVTEGTATVNGASVVAGTTAAAVSAGATLNIYDSHFYGGTTSDFTNAGTLSLSGGWYRNEPEAAWVAAGYEKASSTESYNTRDYAWQLDALPDVATVNGEGYPTWNAAVAAATGYAGSADTVRLQLVDDISGASAATLTHDSKPILLDLNGHTLSTTIQNFIQCTNSLTIVDRAEPKGKITSSESNIIQKNGIGTIILDGCILECTKEAASSVYNEGVVRINNSNSTVRVCGDARIYATKKVAGIAAVTGILIIDDAEVSSGTESAGNSAIVGKTADITINSGSFYSSTTESYYSCLTVGADTGSSSAATGTCVINGGYFYNSGTQWVIRGRYLVQTANITVNGGYFCKSLDKSTDPTYGSGKELKTLSPKATHEHKTTGVSYEYEFQVADK